MSTSRQLNKASGDVDTNITRTGTGIHTVEGNVAGARAARLTKQRETESAAYELKKRKLQDDIQRGARGMDDRFNTASLEFKGQAIGLMTKEEFALKSALEQQPSEEALAAIKAAEDELLRKKRKKEKKATKRAQATLSFGGDDEDGEAVGNDDNDGKGTKSNEDDVPLVVKKVMKNPNAATEFLPDKERELQAELKREQLKVEWLAEQERIKTEKLEVVFSYWDGSGHRRSIQTTKGTSIGKFLESVRTSLAGDFHELRTMSVESLMYVKEDLIIPSNYTFYDLIVTKARGKSGPLFHFDVHEDVRMTNDSRVEKDESHPGKIVARGWYERNKHIFPASRWETYDPSVERGDYTIHGAEVPKD